MSAPTAIEIPDRALFKASEVCELAKVQPYVLKTWEAEFPDLGVAKAAGAARVYRRNDVEQVLKIKHLLLVEGLTLAGARRRMEAESAPVAADEPVIDDLLGAHARERLTQVRHGLRSILELLEGGGSAEFTLSPVDAPAPRTAAPASAAGRAKTPAGPAPSPKRKRSA